MSTSEITRRMDALLQSGEVRGATIAILSLFVVLAVWALLGYLQWVNDDDPAGVLPRREATAVSLRAEPEVPVPQRGPERVVIVLVDGLRADFAGRMRSFTALEERGARLEVDVGLPSMSRPVYAAMGSGTTQERNGIRTNSFHGAATVDSVFERARDAGRRVACVATLGWWKELFSAGFDRHVVASYRSFVEASLLALEGDYDLVLLHTTEVDLAGHQHGARSLEYAGAVREADRALATLSEAVDLSRDALLVISDHGHRNRGGHGGDEPHVTEVHWVAAGVGIRVGAEAEVTASQLGPTLSVLLGVPYPHDAQSPPVLEVLDPEQLGADYLEARAAAFEAQVTGYLAALAAEGEAEFAPEGGFAAWREGMAEARMQGRATRVGLAGLLTIGTLLLILHERREKASRVVLGGLVFVAVYVVAGAITGSLSSLSAAEREYRYLLRLMALGLMSFIGQHLVIHWMRIRDWGTAYLLGAWIPAATAMLVFAWYGFPLTPPMPSPLLTFWPLFAILMTFSQAGAGTVSLVVLRVAERRAARRPRPAGAVEGAVSHPE